MKIITSKITPFDAILSGSVQYHLSDEPVTVQDKDAEFIRQRWGNLVEIAEATIELTVDAIQTKETIPAVEEKVAETIVLPSTEDPTGFIESQKVEDITDEFLT